MGCSQMKTQTKWTNQNFVRGRILMLFWLCKAFNIWCNSIFYIIFGAVRLQNRTRLDEFDHVDTLNEVARSSNVFNTISHTTGSCFLRKERKKESKAKEILQLSFYHFSKTRAKFKFVHFSKLNPLLGAQFLSDLVQIKRLDIVQVRISYVLYLRNGEKVLRPCACVMVFFYTKS